MRQAMIGSVIVHTAASVGLPFPVSTYSTTALAPGAADITGSVKPSGSNDPAVVRCPRELPVAS
jgi:hypothetical protein